MTKKKEYITLRCDAEIKKWLEEEAERREWSISHLTEKIIREYVINQKNKS